MKVTDEFYQFALNDVCQSYKSMIEYIDFVKKAHSTPQCPVKCPTMTFPSEKKDYFTGLCSITLQDCALKSEYF